MTDDEFMQGFEACTIPHEEWTHRAHIRMAYVMLKRDPLAEAIPKVRAGIQKLNASQSTPEAIDRGYHETITVAWLRLVDSAMRAYGAGQDFEAFAQQHPHLLCRTLLRSFYTRDTIMTWEAKKGWVDPDLARLPG